MFLETSKAKESQRILPSEEETHTLVEDEGGKQQQCSVLYEILIPEEHLVMKSYRHHRGGWSPGLVRGQNLCRMASCPPLLQLPGLPQTRSSSGEAQPGAGRSLVGSQLSDSNPSPRGLGRGALAAFFFPSLGFSSPARALGHRASCQDTSALTSKTKAGPVCTSACRPA